MTLLVLFLAISASFTLQGCRLPAVPAEQAEPSRQAVYRKLTAQEAKAQLDRDPAITLVDVRTEQEYREKRIAGSILLPDYDVEKLAPTLLPNKDDKILLYCRSGRRSRLAAMQLIEMGYTNVYDFGGIIDWPYATVSGN